MPRHFFIKRTAASDHDFQMLVSCLDHELWHELKEDQATYDQHNKVPDLQTVLVAYHNETPVGCGCFKAFDSHTVEIKRMFVQKAWRGRGLSKKILQGLEEWATEQGYQAAVLETSIHFATARRLYQSGGYVIIPNYPPYTGLPESVCMKKELTRVANPGSL
ncbi:MAG: GNAT family N-acetyltransferase [Flavisolibacter sp.]|jgi:GNAT superfamily N-acetyltransferase